MSLQVAFSDELFVAILIAANEGSLSSLLTVYLMTNLTCVLR